MNGKKRKAVEDESELDETIAQAFRARGMDKQHHKDIIQYKSRVLDFIQEVLKSNYRLNLIAVRLPQSNLSKLICFYFFHSFQYLIKTISNLLFETQTKANLKFLLQLFFYITKEKNADFFKFLKFKNKKNIFNKIYNIYF